MRTHVKRRLAVFRPEVVEEPVGLGRVGGGRRTATFARGNPAEAEVGEPFALAVLHEPSDTESVLVPGKRIAELTESEREQTVTIQSACAKPCRLIRAGCLENAGEEVSAAFFIRGKNPQTPGVGGQFDRR